MVTPPQERPDRNANRWRSRVTLLLALLILIPSFWGFGNKFLEFVAIYRGEVDGAFAVAPLLNYLLASTGFLLLFFWGAMNGMFHDIERPKYTMLDTERRLDEQRSRERKQHGRKNHEPKHSAGV